MKYEIGQKVETPLGNGVIKKVETWIDGHTQFVVFINGVFVTLSSSQVKPYRTPHDKLLDMGYELDDRIDVKIYRHDTLSDVRVYDDNTISCNEITLELSRILTEYLEWLEEEK